LQERVQGLKGPFLIMPGMAALRNVFCFLCSAACIVAKDLGGGWKEKTNDEGKKVQELKIEAPSFTEEDQYGYVMPDRYRCNACKAVMFHLDANLRNKQPLSRRLKEWEYTDILDDTCRGSFEGYGVRLINGENTLSGPGLKQDDQLAPGSGAIQMGGESWGKRIGEICRKIVFENIGEDEIYDRFYKTFITKEGDGSGSSLGLNDALCIQELRHCEMGPRPPAKSKSDKSTSKEKSSDAKARSKMKGAKAGKAKTTTTTTTMSKTAAKSSSKAVPGSHSAAPSSAEAVDVQTFLRGLAVRHGLTSDEYLAARSFAEWERLTVAMAGRIFNRLSQSSSSDSCQAQETPS